MVEREVAEPCTRALASLTDVGDARLRAELVLAWILGLALSRIVNPGGELNLVQPEVSSRLVLRTAATCWKGFGSRTPCWTTQDVTTAHSQNRTARLSSVTSDSGPPEQPGRMGR